MEENNIPSHRCLKDGEPQYKTYEICCSTGECVYKGSGDGLRPSCNYDEADQERFLLEVDNEDELGRYLKDDWVYRNNNE